MQEIQSLDWEDFLQEEMATHSTALAWEISWTEETVLSHFSCVQLFVTLWTVAHQAW